MKRRKPGDAGPVGSTAGSPLTSTYVFTRDVLGYDLAGFFQRNSERIRSEVDKLIEALLR